MAAIAVSTTTDIIQVIQRAGFCVLLAACVLVASLVRSSCSLGLDEVVSEQLLSSDPRKLGMLINEQEFSRTKTTVLVETIDSRDICLEFWVFW